jgi:hypothetical protein
MGSVTFVHFVAQKLTLKTEYLNFLVIIISTIHTGPQLPNVNMALYTFIVPQRPLF